MLQTDVNAQANPATLVVFLNIHEQGTDEHRCGPLTVSNLITALAVNYVLTRNNALISSGFNFDLRALVMDTCYNSLRIDQDLLSLIRQGSLCNEEFDSHGDLIDGSTIMGVMTTFSRYVVAANRVTVPFKIQIMSSSATSTALSDQYRYPYFARTVPPDDVQMAVIGNMLKMNDWSYIGIIYTLESYGINGYRTLQRTLNNGNVSCIAVAKGIDYPPTVGNIRPSIENIVDIDGVNVIVVVSIEVVPVLQAIIDEGVADRFVVILTDTWADNPDMVRHMAPQFLAVFGIGFNDALYTPFINYVTGIRYDNRMGIPDDWFDEFYQIIHECHLPGARVVLEYEEECQTDLTISAEDVKKYGVGKRQLMAVYALREGLRQFSLENNCGSVSFAECMETVNSFDRDARAELFDKTLMVERRLQSVSWEPPQNVDFELGDDRYWNIGYLIYTFSRMMDDPVEVRVSHIYCYLC